ncbi:MAG: T9SS type A sorting domain-containing protein, partial [Cyclobacteriaceae bacterium]|nr:T9SS type A sorting domain-containing protein [Cyclobacteriaceae bacterium HetDA_MAG_MS6]
IPFILGASVNLPSLLTKLDDAEGALLDFSQEPFFDETFFSCEGGVVDINPASGAQFEFYSDRAGSQLIGSGDSLQIGPLDSDTVIYISNIDDGYNQTIRAVSVEILEEIASFELSLDTLYLGDEPVNKVEFEDKSFAPLSWYWDFGNGSEASVQHPTMIYNTAGTYTISLTVQNAQGCEDTESKTLLVAERPLQPDFQNFSICWGELVSFETTSMDTLRQYQSAFGDVVIQEGTPLIVGPITSDTSIFLTNSSGPFESKITVVNITLHSTDASFQYTPAIDSSATDYAWFTHDSPQTIQTGWFVNGIQQSTDDTLTLLVDESQYTIKLVTESATGCLDSLEQVIRFSPSPTPQIPDLSVCENEAVVISPSNGTYFGFYQDEELSALIQKGSAVEISNITSDTSLFIVGLDSILPSPPIAVNINLVSFHANIQAQPSTLLLNERRDVVFNVNIAAQEYRWYIDGAIKATIAEPRFFFDSAGTHEIVLEAFDEHNCQSFDTLTYEVLEEAPLGFGHDDEWKIFPNPVTDGVVHIQSKSKILKLEFVDMAGRIVLQKTQNIVEFSDVSSLYRGTYLLRLQFDSGDLYTQKIVIQ